MIDLSPLYTEATRLCWWGWLPILIPLMLSLTCLCTEFFGLPPISTWTLRRLHSTATVCWIIVFFLLFVPLFAGPRMADVTGRVEQATGVTQLQCEHRSLSSLTRQPTACSFRYGDTFYQGALTVNDNHQATLYSMAQGTPIPVTRR